MPVYKDKDRGTWYASFYYTDWQGHRKLKKKRGFARQKDAKAFEDEFLRTKARSCDMSFGSMVELYLADMEHRLKATTMQTKRGIIEHHVLPFFSSLSLTEISPAHIRKWQAGLLASALSPTFIKTINNQISAIFNYAVKYYGLTSNPARVAGSVGKKDADEMKFWTVEQFNEFIPHVPTLPGRTGLSVLFWTGLRIGELLALTPADINLEAHTLTVNKNFQMVQGEALIMEPKTQKSRRMIPIPLKLCNELKAYMDSLYDLKPDDRIFPFHKSYFHRHMQKGCDACGMEKIRLHDLRHSHAALLISLGTPILLVSERLGHEDVQTTLRTYGHLYPSATDEAVKKLDKLMR